MLQRIKISGFTGSAERPGMFQEEHIVRTGDEVPLVILTDAICVVYLHEITAGELGYIVLGGGVVCTAHISNIITHQQFAKYQSVVS